MVFRNSFKITFVHYLPFFLLRKGEYLSDSSSWKLCTAPANVVEFHIGMFATLLALSCLEIILCAIQMVNGLVGCLCGTCAKKTVRWST